MRMFVRVSVQHCVGELSGAIVYLLTLVATGAILKVLCSILKFLYSVFSSFLATLCLVIF